MKRWIQVAGLFLVLLVCSLRVVAQSETQHSFITSSATRLSVVEEKSLQKFIKGRDREPRRGFNLFSREAEEQMGDEASAEIEANAKLLHDESLTTYLGALGRKLAANSAAREIQFRFRVLDNDEVNGMALPNGVVYVNSGLLLASRSEAELAGVLAHEIAHVAARHASRAATRRGLWGMAAFATTIASGGIGSALQPFVGLAGGGFLMRFSRNSEQEADLLSLTYLDAAGYDPNSFVAMLERMSASEVSKGKLARLNASHPATEERVRRAQRAIELMLQPREMYVDDTSDFIAARNRAIELTHPEMLENTRPVLRMVKSD